MNRQKQLIAGEKFEREIMESFKHVFGTGFKEDAEDKVDLKQLVTYQCKSMGKILREHKMAAEHFKWVEIHNVHGDGGVMLSEVDFIVYEMRDYYLVVSRKKLFDFLKGKLRSRVTRDELVQAVSSDSLYDVVYRPYSRATRKDVLILVPTVDLIYAGGNLVKRM